MTFLCLEEFATLFYLSQVRSFYFSLINFSSARVSLILVTHIWTQHLLHKNKPRNPEVVCECQEKKKVHLCSSLLIFIHCWISYHKDEKHCYFSTIGSSLFLKLFLCLILEINALSQYSRKIEQLKIYMHKTTKPQIT